MNNELMNDENFIRCSTMIAELLMKYKLKADKDNGEVGMQEASPSHYFFYVENKFLIAYNNKYRWLLLTKCVGGTAVYGKCIYLYESVYADSG